MSTITSFLTFNGNCREAMTFYRECLGGALTFQTLGEAPFAEEMPNKMKDYILYSTLQNGNLLLSGSDMAPEDGLIKGNAVALCLTCDSESEITHRFKTLAAGGMVTADLAYNEWGEILASLMDRYGNFWLLSYGNY